MTDTDNDEPEVRRRSGPMTFAREVRAEARKVTWATRSEVIVSTVAVLMMGAAAAVFFFFIDTVLQFGIRLLLGINS